MLNKRQIKGSVVMDFYNGVPTFSAFTISENGIKVLLNGVDVSEEVSFVTSNGTKLAGAVSYKDEVQSIDFSAFTSYSIDVNDVVKIVYHQDEDLLSTESEAPDLLSTLDGIAPTYVEAMSQVYGTFYDTQYAADFKAVSEAQDRLSFLSSLQMEASNLGHAKLADIRAEMVSLGQSITATVNTLLSAMSATGDVEDGYANLQIACNVAGAKTITQTSVANELFLHTCAIYGNSTSDWTNHYQMNGLYWYNDTIYNISHGLYVPVEDVTFDADMNNFAIDFSNAKLSFAMPNRSGGTIQTGGNNTTTYKRMVWNQGEGVSAVENGQEYLFINDYNTRTMSDSNEKSWIDNMMLSHLRYMKSYLPFLQGDGQESAIAITSRFASRAGHLAYMATYSTALHQIGDIMTPPFQFEDMHTSPRYSVYYSGRYGHTYGNNNGMRSLPRALYVHTGGSSAKFTQANNTATSLPTNDTEISDVKMFLWDENNLNGEMYTIKYEPTMSQKDITFRGSDAVMNAYYSPNIDAAGQAGDWLGGSDDYYTQYRHLPIYFTKTTAYVNMYKSDGSKVDFDASKKWSTDSFRNIKTTSCDTIGDQKSYSSTSTINNIQNYNDDIRSEAYMVGLGQISTFQLDPSYDSLLLSVSNPEPIDSTISYNEMSSRNAFGGWRFHTYYRAYPVSVVGFLDCSFDDSKFNKMDKCARVTTIPFNSNEINLPINNGMINPIGTYLDGLTLISDATRSDFKTYIESLDNDKGNIMFKGWDYFAANYKASAEQDITGSSYSTEKFLFEVDNMDNGAGGTETQYWINSYWDVNHKNLYNNYAACMVGFDIARIGEHYFIGTYSAQDFYLSHDNGDIGEVNKWEAGQMGDVYQQGFVGRANSGVNYGNYIPQRDLNITKSWTDEWKTATEEPLWWNSVYMDFTDEDNWATSNDITFTAWKRGGDMVNNINGFYTTDRDGGYPLSSNINNYGLDYVMVTSPNMNWQDVRYAPSLDYSTHQIQQGLQWNTNSAAVIGLSLSYGVYPMIFDPEATSFTSNARPIADFNADVRKDGFQLNGTTASHASWLPLIIPPYVGNAYNAFTRDKYTESGSLDTAPRLLDSHNYYYSLVEHFADDVSDSEILNEVEFLGSIYDRKSSSFSSNWEAQKEKFYPGGLYFEIYDAAATAYDTVNAQSITGVYKLLGQQLGRSLYYSYHNSIHELLYIAGYTDMKDLYSGEANLVVKGNDSHANWDVHFNPRNGVDAVNAGIAATNDPFYRYNPLVDGHGYYFGTTAGNSLANEQNGKLPSKAFIYNGQLIATGWEIKEADGVTGTGKYIWCFELNGLLKRLTYLNSTVTHWKDMANVTLDTSIQNSSLKCMYVHSDDISFDGTNLTISAMATGDFLVSEHYEISSTAGDGSIDRTDSLLASGVYIDYEMTSSLYEKSGDLTTLYDGAGNLYTGNAWSQDAVTSVITGYEYSNGVLVQQFNTDTTYGYPNGDTSTPLWLGGTDGLYYERSTDTLSLYNATSQTNALGEGTINIDLADSYGDGGAELLGVHGDTTGNNELLFIGLASNWASHTGTTGISVNTTGGSNWDADVTLSATGGSTIYLKLDKDYWPQENTITVTHPDGTSNSYLLSTANVTWDGDIGYLDVGTWQVYGTATTYIFQNGVMTESGVQSGFADGNGNDILEDNGTYKTYDANSNSLIVFDGLGYDSNGSIVVFTNGALGSELYVEYTSTGFIHDTSASVYDDINTGETTIFELNGSTFSAFTGFTLKNGTDYYEYINGNVENTYVAEPTYGTKLGGGSLYDQAADGSSYAYDFDGSAFSLYTGFSESGSTMYEWSNGVQINTYNADATLGTQNYDGTGLLFNNGTVQSFDGSSFVDYTGNGWRDVNGSGFPDTMYEYTSGVLGITYDFANFWFDASSNSYQPADIDGQGTGTIKMYVNGQVEYYNQPVKIYDGTSTGALINFEGVLQNVANSNLREVTNGVVGTQDYSLFYDSGNNIFFTNVYNQRTLYMEAGSDYSNTATLIYVVNRDPNDVNNNIELYTGTVLFESNSEMYLEVVNGVMQQRFGGSNTGYPQLDVNGLAGSQYKVYYDELDNSNGYTISVSNFVYTTTLHTGLLALSLIEARLYTSGVEVIYARAAGDLSVGTRIWKNLSDNKYYEENVNGDGFVLFTGTATINGSSEIVDAGVIQVVETNSNGDTITLNTTSGQLEDANGDPYSGDLTSVSITTTDALNLNDGVSNHYGYTNFGNYDDSSRFAIVIGGYVLGIGHTEYYAGYGDFAEGNTTSGTITSSPVGITPDAMDDLVLLGNVNLPAHPTGGNWEDETNLLAFTVSYDSINDVWTFTKYDGALILADNSSQHIYEDGILVNEIDTSEFAALTYALEERRVNEVESISGTKDYDLYLDSNKSQQLFTISSQPNYIFAMQIDGNGKKFIDPRITQASTYPFFVDFTFYRNDSNVHTANNSWEGAKDHLLDILYEMYVEVDSHVEGNGGSLTFQSTPIMTRGNYKVPVISGLYGFTPFTHHAKAEAAANGETPDYDMSDVYMTPASWNPLATTWWYNAAADNNTIHYSQFDAPGSNGQNGYKAWIKDAADGKLKPLNGPMFGSNGGVNVVEGIAKNANNQEHMSKIKYNFWPGIWAYNYDWKYNWPGDGRWFNLNGMDATDPGQLGGLLGKSFYYLPSGTNVHWNILLGQSGNAHGDAMNPKYPSCVEFKGNSSELHGNVEFTNSNNGTSYYGSGSTFDIIDGSVTSPYLGSDGYLTSQTNTNWNWVTNSSNGETWTLKTKGWENDLGTYRNVVFGYNYNSNSEWPYGDILTSDIGNFNVNEFQYSSDQHLLPLNAIRIDGANKTIYADWSTYFGEGDAIATKLFLPSYQAEQGQEWIKGSTQYVRQQTGVGTNKIWGYGVQGGYVKSPEWTKFANDSLESHWSNGNFHQTAGLLKFQSGGYTHWYDSSIQFASQSLTPANNSAEVATYYNSSWNIQSSANLIRLQSKFNDGNGYTGEMFPANNGLNALYAPGLMDTSSQYLMGTMPFSHNEFVVNGKRIQYLDATRGYFAGVYDSINDTYSGFQNEALDSNGYYETSWYMHRAGEFFVCPFMDSFNKQVKHQDGATEAGLGSDTSKLPSTVLGQMEELGINYEFKDSLGNVISEATILALYDTYGSSYRMPMWFKYDTVNDKAIFELFDENTVLHYSQAGGSSKVHKVNADGCFDYNTYESAQYDITKFEVTSKSLAFKQNQSTDAAKIQHDIACTTFFDDVYFVSQDEWDYYNHRNSVSVNVVTTSDGTVRYSFGNAADWAFNTPSNTGVHQWTNWATGDANKKGIVKVYCFGDHSGHELGFSETQNGTHNGGTEFTTGISSEVISLKDGMPAISELDFTGNEQTYDVTVYTIQVEPGVTPSALYLYCKHHSGMVYDSNFKIQLS